MALNKNILTLALILFLFNASHSAIAIEATPQWQSKVHANIKAKSPSTAHIWKELISQNTVTGKNLGKDKRRVFTLVQASVEEELTAALNAKSVKSAVIIIHTLMPPTPLRVGSRYDDLHVKQLNISPKSQSILLQRKKILTKYLEAGGTLVAAYQASPKLAKSKGFNQYLSYAAKHKLLLDRPVKEVPSKYWGATYLVRQLDDSIIAFCITSSQANSLADTHDLEWQMWTGSLLEAKISKRVVQVESFLKSENIDIYEVLGFKSKE